jgi:hypothetical protein
MRAGDRDREQVVQALQRHTGAGRLTLDEFATRAEAAHRAVTYGDLAALTADLRDELDRRRLPRGPLAVALVVAVMLALLLGVGATAQAAGVLHMTAMMAGMGAAMPGCG